MCGGDRRADFSELAFNYPAGRGKSPWLEFGRGQNSTLTYCKTIHQSVYPSAILTVIQWSGSCGRKGDTARILAHRGLLGNVNDGRIQIRKWL